MVPEEPAFAELGRIDPLGSGTHACDINPGVPVRLSPRVIRVSANNGSMMTGPGTNTYLIGGGDETSGPSSTPVPSIPPTSGHPRRGAGTDPLDLRHPHPQRSLAGHGRAEGGDRCARPWPRRRAPRMAGREFRARCGARGRRAPSCRAAPPCARSTRRATPRTTSATCWRRRRRSSPATTSCRRRPSSSTRRMATWRPTSPRCGPCSRRTSSGSRRGTVS